MRFSIDALRVAANAAHKFPPGYVCTTSHDGYPCPAAAMSHIGHGYHFFEMCDLLWHSAGCPIAVDKWGRKVLSNDEDGPLLTESRAWFQTTLSDDPKLIARMFDSILFCAGAIPACGAPEESEALQCA